MANVIIGCKLPHGIVLEHPLDSTKTKVIKGLNREIVVGSGYGTTEVDIDFWEQWVAVNKEFVPFKNGSIFVAKNKESITAVAKEYEKVKTGLEPIDPNAKVEGGLKKLSAKDDE